MSEEMKLLPCPFCGDSRFARVASSFEDEDYAELYAGSPETWNVVCDASNSNSGCGAGSGFYFSSQEAIERWNRRANGAALSRTEPVALWWNAICPKCNWRGTTEFCTGGGQIADTGDYDDPTCPKCGAVVDEDDHPLSAGMPSRAEIIEECAKVCDEWEAANDAKESEASAMGYTESANYHRGARYQLAGCASAIRALALPAPEIGGE